MDSADLDFEGLMNSLFSDDGSVGSVEGEFTSSEGTAVTMTTEAMDNFELLVTAAAQGAT
jgi:hypothetical protein